MEQKISGNRSTFRLSKYMFDSIKSAEKLKEIGQIFHDARMNYMGSEGKKRSLGKKGISLRDLAAVTQVKYTQILAIEKGQSNATILTLIAIASVLDVNLCEVLNLKESEKGKKKK